MFDNLRSLAADRGYDLKAFSDEHRSSGMHNVWVGQKGLQAAGSFPAVHIADHIPRSYADHSHGVRPYIKHRIYSSVNHVHNGHMDSDRYRQRQCLKTSPRQSSARLAPLCVRKVGILEFRELVFKVAVYNIQRSVRLR